MHDKRRGALSLVRILNGTLRAGVKLKTSSGNVEVVERIFEPLADEFKEISSIGRGNVAICSGLKVRHILSLSKLTFGVNRIAR